MAVFVDMLGGSSAFPPQGTQLREFSDNFNRVDADTLGTAWGVAWQYADYPYNDTARPRPYDAAVNPKIANGKFVWFMRRAIGDQGAGYSIAWPWKLAWMTQAKVDQYAEMTVDYIEPSGSSGVMLAVVCAQASGSMDPDYYGQEYDTALFKGQYGAYTWSPGAFIYNCFGANPSATPDGLRGHAGINYVVIGTTPAPVGPYPLLLRLEARWKNSTWELTSYVNGVQQGQVTDDRLLMGMPAVAMSSYVTPADPTWNPDPLAIISSFRAGALPGVTATTPVPLWTPPPGTQLPVMVDNFVVSDNPNGKINSRWRLDYIGSDSLNMGLPVTIDNTYNAITFTPVGQDPPSQGYFQSGVVLTPLPLAWFTQIRSTHMSVITIVNESLTQPGLCALSAICCLSAGLQSGQCYSLTAATYGDPSRSDLVLQIQKWSLPNVPNIGTALPPNTRWLPTNLLACGLVHSGDRIYFQAINQGTSWRLIAAVIPNFLGDPGPLEVRGVFTDSTIGAGQPALAGITFAGTEAFQMRDFVGGWGPTDVPLA